MQGKVLKKKEANDVLFNTIDQANLLTQSDFESLVLLTGELQETFIKTQVHRTRTEMEVSVLNDLKHPTHASKYWQAMREQSSFYSRI